MQRPREGRRGLRGSYEGKEKREESCVFPRLFQPFLFPSSTFSILVRALLLSSPLLSSTKTRSSRNHDRAPSFGFETFLANSFLSFSSFSSFLLLLSPVSFSSAFINRRCKRTTVRLHGIAEVLE